MPKVFASKTRKEIRQAIIKNTEIGIVGTAKSTVDTSSLIDTVGLGGRGDDDVKNWLCGITTPVGSIVAGEQQRVTGFAASTSDATTGAFSASITNGDGYELLRPPFTFDSLNSRITDAENAAVKRVLVDKEDHSTCIEDDRYLYAIPTGFVALHTIEYENGTDKTTIHKCDVVWDELVDGDVTASADTSFKKEGSACLKLVVGADCAADDILATMDITSLDLTGCTEVEIWIYSTVALDAGDLHLLLDNTASCASPVETLDIPATTANTWTRHVISLANPESDSAIISVGIEMEVDKGAFTLYTDDIVAVNGNERKWEEMLPEYWDIVRGSTDYLKLDANALSLVSTGDLLRLTGYQKITAMSADTSTSEVDPDFILAYVAAELCQPEKQAMWQARADQKYHGLTTNLAPNTRFI